MDMMKMLRGAVSAILPDGGMMALACSLGFEDVTELKREQLPTAFQDAVKQSQKPGAHVLRMKGRWQGGGEMCALVIVTGELPQIEGEVKQGLLLCPGSVNGD